jgi:hypothetical protein
LSKRLPIADWLLVDQDEALLAVARRQSTAVRAQSADLSSLNSPHVAALFHDRDFVTASALLDLVSDRWLRELAARCRERRACVLLALTYDGRLAFAPVEPEDDDVLQLVNAHQRTDKGFGVALGPDAADAAAKHFAAAGYHVERDASDWVLTSGESELQRQLIDGWKDAAIAMAPERADAIAKWSDRRIAHVNAGRSRIVVGHQDIAAW